MASPMSCNFLFASALGLCFFFCSFFNNIIAIESRDDLQHTQLLHLTSLFPSSNCASPPTGPKKKASLEVVHKHGPCFEGKQEKAKTPTHSDILREDQFRVKSLHSRLSNFSYGNFKELESTNLPVNSGESIGSGNYIVTVGLGSPKRDLSLIFDTGSDLTWTQCEPCSRSCYKQLEPTFDPSKSSSYSNITCTSSLCTLLSSAGIIHGCAKSTGACVYAVQYGDFSFSVGYFSKEKLIVTATDVINNYLFGCGQYNRGHFGRGAGILGLGRHPISFIQQTANKYQKIFSYCLPSTPSYVGHLTFGVAPSPNVKYTPISTISKSSLYGLNLIGITVGGTILPISASVFSSAGAIIDSGTVISRLPPAAYLALKEAFQKAMSKYPVAGKFSILDTCYDLSGYTTISIPKITLVFGGGVTVELAASGILYVVSEKQVCLAFAGNRYKKAFAIIGNLQQTTIEIVYDVGGERVGFGPAGCK